MTEQALTLIYTAPAATTARPRVRLEQAPVSSNRLTLTDLSAMVALIASGISAQTYQSRDCEAWVAGDMVYADLVAYAWPTTLDLEYQLSGDLVEPGAVTRIEMEREFDLVVPMRDRVELPFLVRNARLEWQTPCYSQLGEIVDRPTLRIEGDQLHLDAEVFGVLRFRGLALGYRHALHFAMAKNMQESITQLEPALTALWMDGEEQQSEWLRLQLPGCLETLLAACEDGVLLRERVFGVVTGPDELVPVVYYSACTGQVVELRYERP